MIYISPTIMLHSHAILAPYHFSGAKGIIVTGAMDEIWGYIDALTAGEFGQEYYIDIEIFYDENKRIMHIKRKSNGKILWIIKHREFTKE